MTASDIQNPPAGESKTAKKKKAKAAAVAATTSNPAPVAQPTAPASGPGSSDGDANSESPYIKELEKSIRSVNKKISNASRVDNVLAENPDQSLDQLVASRKINADQKAQILKKPALQAQLIQFEEQLATYKKIDSEYKSKAQADKAELEKSFSEKAKHNLSEALASAQAEAAALATKEQQANMLLLSQFLRLAAARRADEDADPNADENQALEGVLLQVYSGDETAVAAMIKLTSGAEEPTYSVTGDPLTTTYAQVKAQAIALAPPYTPIDELVESPAVEAESYPVESDPTIANAGMTELDDLPSSLPVINGHGDAHAEADAVGIPQNAGIDEGASNEAAETHWDTAKPESLSASQDDWVKVPRDVSETDTGIEATPAAHQAPQQTIASWAEETSQAAPSSTTADGFHEVARSKGQGQGQNRGRGGRGRGRGGPRGGRGAPRGQGQGQAQGYRANA